MPPRSYAIMNHTAHHHDEADSISLSTGTLSGGRSTAAASRETMVWEAATAASATSAASAAVATMPQQETLYQELLRYHQEERATKQQHKRSSFSSSSCCSLSSAAAAASAELQSVHSEDDRKLPAKPTTTATTARFANDNTASCTSNDSLVLLERHKQPETLRKESPSLYSAHEEFSTEKLRNDVLLRRPEDVSSSQVVSRFETPPSVLPDNKSLATNEAHHAMSSSSSLHHEQNQNVRLPDNMDKRRQQETTSLPSLASVAASASLRPADAQPPLGSSSATTTRQQGNDNSDDVVIQKKSSFYESALEASGHTAPTLEQEQDLNTDQDLLRLQKDEQLARELAKRLELQDAVATTKTSTSATTTTPRSSLPPQPPTLSSTATVSASQFEIMEAIRKEAERQQLEQALRESSSTNGVGGSRLSRGAVHVQKHFHDTYLSMSPSSSDGNNNNSNVDFLLSQQLALEECKRDGRAAVSSVGATSSFNHPQQQQQRLRPPPLMVRRTSSERRPPSSTMLDSYRPDHNTWETSTLPAPARRSSSFTTMTTTANSSSINAASQRRQSGHAPSHARSVQQRPNGSQPQDALVQRGSLETQEAIANGRSHVVQCQGCLCRMHAPISYALVYCPKCHTVSPGQTYIADNSTTTTTTTARGSVNNRNRPRQSPPHSSSDFHDDWTY